MDSGETLTHDLPLPFDLLYDEGFCLPAVHQKNTFGKKDDSSNQIKLLVVP